MLARETVKATPELAAIDSDAMGICAVRLTRVAGTHALLLDGLDTPVPAVAGVGRWTVLRPRDRGEGWTGAIRTDAAALPFGDDSFCAVLVRFADAIEGGPESIAGELARVLAPHGTLLVAGLHPYSLWHAGVPPSRWERALRAADLHVASSSRCGAPWPRARGEAGLPHWLTRVLGGAYVVEAHRRALTAIPLRSPGRRRTAEAKTLVPDARRQCA